MEQKTLPGVPRVRVPIRDDATAGAVQGDKEFDQPYRGHEMAVDEEAFIGYTRWSTAKPPGPGWWEVTDHRTGTVLRRWWFDGLVWVMGPDPTRPGVDRVGYEKFAQTWAWRGLAGPALRKYPCPPYNLRSLPQGCQLDVVSILPLVPERRRLRDL